MSFAPTNPKCPLCFANNQLRGGEVYAETTHFYLYIFRDEAGKIVRGMLNPKGHVVDLSLLPSGAGDEYLSLRGLARRELFPEQDYNTYSNEGGPKSLTEGKVAGVQIIGHLHEHIHPRHDGLPSSYKGLALLERDYNDAVS